MSSARVPAALRRQVHARAMGRCEYCLAPEALCFNAHQVDHIIAEKHGGATTPENLALSCVACNLHKGTDLASVDPVTGELASLFHPRSQRWRDHFELRGLFIMPRSPAGRVTTRLLQFNAPDRITEREWFVQAGEIVIPPA